MNTREISARLHDILGTACRVRQPKLGRPADAALVGIDEVKAGLRDLIRALGDEPPTGPTPRAATASMFPERQVTGTRTVVEHRRRRGPRSASDPVSAGRRLPPDLAAARHQDPSGLRQTADAEFARLTRRPAAL